MFKKNITALLGYVAINFILLVVGLVLYKFSSLTTLNEYLKIMVVGGFLINAGAALFVQKLRIYHPYFMFLGVFAFFFLSRIVLDMLGSFDFSQTTQFTHYKFSDKTVSLILVNLLVALFSIQLTSFVMTDILKKRLGWQVQSNIIWTRLGLIFFYIGLPFYVYHNLRIGLEIQDIGYSAKLAGEATYRSSTLVSLLSRMSFCGFFVYLAGFSKAKSYYIHLVVFVLAFYLNLLAGARFYVIAVSLVLISYTLYRSDKRFLRWGMLLTILALFGASIIVGATRSKQALDNQNHLVFNFIKEQGFAVQILGYSIEHREDVHYTCRNMMGLTLFRIDALRGRFANSQVDMNKNHMLDTYGLLAHQLTDVVNKNALSAGWDMSSNYLSESYVLAKEWGNVLGNVFIVSVLFLLCAFLTNSNAGLLLYLLVLPSWGFVPRYFSDVITVNLTNSIIILLMLLVVFFVKRYFGDFMGKHTRWLNKIYK